MRLSRVIPSEAVTKTRQTYFGILETARVRYITLRAVQASKLRRRSFSREATCLRSTRILLEYHAQPMLGRKFISLSFSRDRDESGAKRSTRADFSLLNKFSWVSSDLDPPDLDRSSLGIQVRHANTRIIGDSGEIYGFSLGFLSGTLTVVIVVNSAYVPAIAGTL